MMGKRNIKFLNDFKLYLKKANEVKPYSTNSSFYSSDYKTIFFYEWSTMDKGSKSYSKLDDFLKFCKDSNIDIPPVVLSDLKVTRTTYCTCVPGSNKLMMAYTYYGLDGKLKEFKTESLGS